MGPLRYIIHMGGTSLIDSYLHLVGETSNAQVDFLVLISLSIYWNCQEAAVIINNKNNNETAYLKLVTGTCSITS